LKNYSFIKQPIESLHDAVISILPGIEKIISVHADETNKLSGLLSEKEQKTYRTRPLNLSKIEPLLKRFRYDHNPFDWYSRQNLPFEIDKKTGNPTIDIFSELQNVVLLIRIPDEETGENILVFIYLNENPSNFGITNSINPLTTDNKSIIAYILRNTLITYLNREKENKEVLISNNYRTKTIIDQAEQQKQETLRTREYYGLSLVKLCQQYLTDYSKTSGRNLFFSADAIEKIKGYKGDLKSIELIIEKTVSYAQSLNFDAEGDIEITDWHLQFEGPEKQFISSERPAHEGDKYAKTVSLLDKLESAALKVKSQQLKLTGTNVGQACPVPITAPAITDALYNHKSKINTLVKMNPDRWNTIRGEFRPVINILKDENKKA
jgi:hypothetical protein